MLLTRLQRAVTHTNRDVVTALLVAVAIATSGWAAPLRSLAQTAASTGVDQQSGSAPVRVSSGVAVGNIIRRVTPVYPLQARAHHIEGSVVLHAVIGKDGAIHNLSAISGPPLLQSSAMDAVRQWKFKPYLLNGEPVDIETDIVIGFHLRNH